MLQGQGAEENRCGGGEWWDDDDVMAMTFAAWLLCHRHSLSGARQQTWIVPVGMSVASMNRRSVNSARPSHTLKERAMHHTQRSVKERAQARTSYPKLKKEERSPQGSDFST